MAQETIVAADNEAEAEARKPYVNVTMSAEFKAAIEKAADAAGLSNTAFMRKIVAAEIGYDLSQEPETSTRTKYATDEERDAAKKLASARSGALRQALFWQHTAKVKGDKKLAAKADDLLRKLEDATFDPRSEKPAKAA